MLEYQDAAGNTKATFTSTNVEFSGTSTILPQVNAPQTGHHVPKDWAVDLVFYETMSSCNMTIQTTPEAPVVDEPVAYRLIQFETSPSTIGYGPHQYIIYPLNELVSRSSSFTQVSPSDSLVVGAPYSIS